MTFRLTELSNQVYNWKQRWLEIRFATNLRILKEHYMVNLKRIHLKTKSFDKIKGFKSIISCQVQKQLYQFFDIVFRMVEYDVNILQRYSKQSMSSGSISTFDSRNSAPSRSSLTPIDVSSATTNLRRRSCERENSQDTPKIEEDKQLNNILQKVDSKSEFLPSLKVIFID